jgi:Spy/CpxP family protein refolding chaperone
MRLMSRLLLSGMAAFGAVGGAMAQETAAQPQQPAGRPGLPQGADWRQRLESRHDPQRAIDDQLSRLTQDLELTPEQVEKVKPLLHEHQDKIQAFLDQNPSVTREAYQARVHAISQETHNQINKLLTARQLQLMKAMVARLDNGEENRRAP